MGKLSHLNLNQLSNEMNFLLNLMKEERNYMRWSGIDWELFVQLARHHRIYPNIYQRLKESKEEWIPESVKNRLLKDYQRNTFQMLYLSREMEQLAKIFSDNQIRALFLKGPILAHELYGDVSLRTSSDLDVIVPINDLENINHILTRNGYIKDDYIHTVLNDWKWRHHHMTYFHLQRKVKVEVHWRLNPGPAKEPNFNELWARKRTSDLTSTPVFILGKEDLFLFLILHGARHGWSRLRWLIDIQRITNQELDWEFAKRLLRTYQCTHTAGQALNLIIELLDKSIDVDNYSIINRKRSRRLAQDALFYIKQMVNLHSDPVPDNVAQYHKRHLFSLMSFRQKVLFILSFLFPYPEDAETLPLPRVIHFLYFPLRPFLWLRRKTRKVAPEGVKK